MYQVIFEHSVESFQRFMLRKYHFNPYLFNVTTSFAEDPGRPVIMFGYDKGSMRTPGYLKIFRYPAFRKAMTFLFGVEMNQDDLIPKLRKEISSAQGKINYVAGSYPFPLAFLSQQYFQGATMMT